MSVERSPGRIRPSLLPVILGGDIGGYSLARACHEAYGVRSIIVSEFPTGLVRNSSIVESVVMSNIDNAPALVSKLQFIAADHPDRELLLLGSADWHVRTIVENRELLRDWYTMPYTDLERLDMVTDKENFSRLCMDLGIPHPQTVVYQVGSGRPVDVSGLTFPVIAKTANTAAYHHVDFPGKKKVYEIATQTELDDLMEQLAKAGYRDAFIIQDLIPGDDSHMRILTCYCDRGGKVRFASFGHVLLEEHTPGALGNPAGIVTGLNEEVIAHAVRLLEHIGWIGFANFDIKYDSRDDTYKYFELNPRLGRSNYYVTAAGHNPITDYVHEYLDNGFFSGMTAWEGVHLYTVLPKRLLLSYIADPSLKQFVRQLIREKRFSNALLYKAEKDPRRWLYLLINQLNQYRKYRTYYPRPKR